MNILVVTPFYKHDRNIASVRWTNISTRLAKRHNIIVVTQPHDDMDMRTTIETDEDGILVARINQKTSYEKFAVKHFGAATGDDWQTSANSSDTSDKPKSESIVRKLKNRALFASMKLKARSYAKEIKNNVIPKDMKIDVVISSACPFIEMLFGYELKKLLKCKWISDFRDLPFTDESVNGALIMKRIMISCLKSADAVNTIAKRGKEFLQNGIVDDPNKIHVIPNGFSMADAREPIYQDDKKLHIVHTGSLYGGTRKADLFFKAAQKARQLNPDFSYVLECAGGNNESLIETAKKYGEEENVENRGFVPRQEALAMQAQADILLALVVERTGSFVAKMFEYILNRKPIVCITCGPGKNSEETEFVRNANVGIAVEEKENDGAAVLANYLTKQFQRKLVGQPLEFSPLESELSQFDHDHIAKEFDELISNILN